MFLLIATLVGSTSHNNSVYNQKAGDSNQRPVSGDLFSCCDVVHQKTDTFFGLTVSIFVLQTLVATCQNQIKELELYV